MADNNLAQQIDELRTQMAALQAENERLRASARPEGRPTPTRAFTPAESAFGGGEGYKPAGLAARKCFEPYGKDQYDTNPAYDPSSRARGIDQGKFEGNKDEFKSWVVKLGDKLRAEDHTYYDERARMAVVNALTEGVAQLNLEARYSSETRPFRSAAEMIQALEAQFTDPNAHATAMRELHELQYKPGEDIYRHMAKVNNLADRARYPEDLRKSVLVGTMPPHWTATLLAESNDPSVNYETLALHVASTAQAMTNAWKLKQKQKATTSSSSSSYGKNSGGHGGNKGRPSYDTPRLSEATKEGYVRNGLCFNCGEKGHRSRDCPKRGKKGEAVAAVVTKVSQVAEGQESGSEN